MQKSYPPVRLDDHAAIEPKSVLTAYFDGVGFERWSAIYGDAPLSRVRRTIRRGHAQMLAQAAAWLSETSLPPGAHILDAGCGTGLFSLALAQQGFRVTAVDLAPQMVAAAAQAARRLGVLGQMTFRTGDVETIGDTFDAVVCFDVLVHYDQASFAPLLTRLAQRTHGPLLLTYAPYNPLLAALHWLGGRFPQAERRTAIHMIPAKFVHQTLAAAGAQPRRSRRISHGFYHVTLLEAAPR